MSKAQCVGDGEVDAFGSLWKEDNGSVKDIKNITVQHCIYLILTPPHHHTATPACICKNNKKRGSI